jgi:hypothetical protein
MCNKVGYLIRDRRRLHYRAMLCYAMLCSILFSCFSYRVWSYRDTHHSNLHSSRFVNLPDQQIIFPLPSRHHLALPLEPVLHFQN